MRFVPCQCPLLSPSELVVAQQFGHRIGRTAGKHVDLQLHTPTSLAMPCGQLVCMQSLARICLQMQPCTFDGLARSCKHGAGSGF